MKIRGGMEYGLGIYVSAVDRNHMAEKSGIRVCSLYHSKQPVSCSLFCILNQRGGGGGEM